MKHLLIILTLLLLPLTAQAAMGGAVPYTVNGESFEGYFVSPGSDAPLILLVHDWDGLTDYEIKRADMLAEEDYAVFAVDLFGKGVRPTETADKKRLTGALYADRARMRQLLDGALDKARALAGHGARAVAMGYCFGGTAVMELARSGADLDGFVTFHGGLATPEGQSVSAIKGFVLVFHGTADQAISMDEFAGLAKELESAGIPHEMTTYSGAPHAFTVFGSPRYHRDADRKSWDRFTDFLDDTLDD